MEREIPAQRGIAWKLREMSKMWVGIGLMDMCAEQAEQRLEVGRTPVGAAQCGVGLEPDQPSNQPAEAPQG